MPICINCNLERSASRFHGPQLKSDAPRCKQCVRKMTEPEPEDEAMNKLSLCVEPGSKREQAINVADEEAKNSALLDHARYGELEEMRQMLQSGADVNSKDLGGSTCLHRACANGHKESVELLLEHGAAHLPNDTGNYPLHWAVQNNRQAIVKLLLERVEGLDVLARNNFGRGPLTDAFDVGNTDTVALLLGHPSASEERLAEGSGLEGVKINLDDADSTGNGPKDINASHTSPERSQVIQETELAFRFAEDLPLVKVRELALAWEGDAFTEQAADDTTGLTVWSASILLARYCIHLDKLGHGALVDGKAGDKCLSIFSGASVCELGAGVGLPGITIAKCTQAKEVLLTDLMSHTVKNLEYNAGLNQDNTEAGRRIVSAGLEKTPEQCENCGTCQRFTAENPTGSLFRCGRCRKSLFCSKECQRKAWPTHKLGCGVDAVSANEADKSVKYDKVGCEATVINTSAIDWLKEETWPQGQFDMVVAADIIYQAHIVKPLVKLLGYIIKPGGHFLLSSSDQRRGLPEFETQMKRRNFDFSVTTPDPLWKQNCLVDRDGLFFDSHFGEMSDNYKLYTFTKKSTTKRA